MSNNKPREFWIGVTKDNFAKWLAPKSPDLEKSTYVFLCSDDAESCVEQFSVIEKSVYDSLMAQAQKMTEALENITSHRIECISQSTGIDYGGPSDAAETALRALTIWNQFIRECKDPFHSNESVSNAVYDNCPSCKESK